MPETPQPPPTRPVTEEEKAAQRADVEDRIKRLKAVGSLPQDWKPKESQQ